MTFKCSECGRQISDDPVITVLKMGKEIGYNEDRICFECVEEEMKSFEKWRKENKK